MVPVERAQRMRRYSVRVTRRVTLAGLVAAVLASGCVYRWRPVHALHPEPDWASRIERADATGASYRVARRTRIQRTRSGDLETLRVIEPGLRLQLEGETLVVLGAEPATTRWTDLRLEVQYIDGGFTALNTIFWSAAGTASAFGAIVFTVVLAMLPGDAAAE